MQWPELTWQDLAPAMALGLSDGDVANILGNVGNWIVAAGVAVGNDATGFLQASSGLLGDLILYDAYTRGGTTGAGNLTTLLSSATAAGVNPVSVLSQAVESIPRRVARTPSQPGRRR